MELENRIAIVTGGSRGIGAAIARRLLGDGAKVVIGSRTEPEIERAVEEMSSEGTIRGYRLDVADRGSVQSFVRRVIEDFGRVDILVNCAGVNRRLPADNYPEEEFLRVLNINLGGVYRMCQEVGRYMIPQRYGKIINITSLHSHTIAPNQSAYGPSKAGVAKYTALLAVEWGKYNINVNAVSPGFILTQMTEEYLDHKEFIDKVERQTPFGRFGKPEEVANAVAFLASDRASFIHGVVLPVDGGFLAGFPEIYLPPKN